MFKYATIFFDVKILKSRAKITYFNTRVFLLKSIHKTYSPSFYKALAAKVYNSKNIIKNILNSLSLIV